MKHLLLHKLSNNRLFKALQDAPAPRWIIFALDMLIVAMVALMLILFQPVEYYHSTQLYAYILCLGMYGIMNLCTGTYKCIVRLSMPYDLFKVFWCVLLASAGICAVSGVYALSHEPHRPLIGMFPVLLIGTMVMSLMVSLRIIIKYLFAHINDYTQKRENVIVLGTSINSLAMAITLKNEVNGLFMPVALMDIDGHHKVKKIQDFPVEKFSAEKLEEIFKRRNAETLVFLQTQTQLIRSSLAEAFMNAHINLKVLNQIDEFDVTGKDASPNISAHVNAFKIEDLLGRQVIQTDSRRVQQALNGSTVLITGAAGSIGSEIVRQVASFGADCIVLLDQAETPMHDMQLEMEASYPDTRIALFVADVQNRKRLARAFAQYKPQYVFHAAAYKHVPMMERNPTEAILTNVMGTKNLADLSLQFGVKKFVMVSTDKAVNPTNIMGASKRIAEIYVQSLFYHADCNGDGGDSTRFITTRFGNVLGSNGSVIPLFRRQIEAGGPVTVTHKDIIRYFMTIKEACSLVLEAGCMGHGGEIFLFDMGEPVRIYDLARRMILLAGFKPDVDINIIETGLRPGEKLYEELLNDKEKTLPTDNEKIMVAKVRKYDFQSILPHIEALIKLATEGNTHDMVMTMKGLVPEYISRNSEFESIDKELNHTEPSKAPYDETVHPPKSANV
ncbi:MAG: polysaccharide biosynthesis protein [Prevotella sp.]|nr:polysaccharide biosynthesis protein [Prevotella sp.]MCM1074825.1 polysaccharide biosynthesis protein [Ruminococcus sp.]